MHGAWCPVYCIGPQGNRNVFFLTFSIHTWREMREKTTRTHISPSSHSNQHVQQAPQAPLLDNPTDVMKSHGWWLKVWVFLVIKYLYRQTPMVDPRFTMFKPVKTAIFRWEIHPWCRKRHLTKVSVTPTSVRNSWDQGPGQLVSGQIWKVLLGFPAPRRS